MRLVIVTGMSGAGKSTLLSLLAGLDKPQTAQDEAVQNAAIGIDARSGRALEELEVVLDRLKAEGHTFEILFLDADDKVLVKRYKESRRSHPLAGGGRIDKGIGLERKKLAFLKEQADYIIDTSRLLQRELKAELERIFVRDEDYRNLYITVLSFGFKYGIPTDSDLVFDVRFLPNPYYVEGLRQKTGNDIEIQDFVMQYKEAHEFLDKLEDMIKFLIPNYVTEGKTQLVISIGCTGGKHRSVTLANELYDRLKECSGYGIKIEHRDIGKDALRGK